jgi:hypothetical protein
VASFTAVAIITLFDSNAGDFDVIVTRVILALRCKAPCALDMVRIALRSSLAAWEGFRLGKGLVRAPAPPDGALGDWPLQRCFPLALRGRGCSVRVARQIVLLTLTVLLLLRSPEYPSVF